MRAAILTSMTVLVSLLSAVALAEVPGVSGMPCVTDANTLVINGKRRTGRCEGGTPVRLFGMDAPDLAQTCHDAQEREWMCGRAAAANLLEMVKGRAVDCRGNSKDPQGRLVATCHVGETDVAREMVRQGWGLAHGRESHQYQSDESDAHAAGRGIWGSRFEVPAEWRRKNAPPARR
ncbi:MAG: thermonuclease family protein [Alphaproteobacteria bacterium]